MIQILKKVERFEVYIQPGEGNGQLVILKLKHKLNDTFQVHKVSRVLLMSDYFIIREDK